jgi:predicted component of type VI protein secretion system
MRDKIGGFASLADVSTFLNRWIGNYVQLNDEASAALKARQPLREARVDVTDVRANPGSTRRRCSSGPTSSSTSSPPPSAWWPSCLLPPLEP